MTSRMRQFDETGSNSRVTPFRARLKLVGPIDAGRKGSNVSTG